MGTTLRDREFPIQVLKFCDEMKENVTTYCTLGLSLEILTMPKKDVRQEFIFAAENRFDEGEISSFLLTFAEHVASSGRALLRGNVVGEKPIISNVDATGIYASIPVFWDDNFHIYDEVEKLPSTVFVWLIPVMSKEIKFIRDKGWNAFEDILETSDCNFWDLNRPSVI